MKKRIKEIETFYSTYSSICFEEKISYESKIKFANDKPSRKDTLYHSCALKHIKITEPIDLLTEQRKDKRHYYKFQIRCVNFCPVPLFRFDSDGLAHRNSHMPLSKQQVPTPHFNKYDDQGRSVAYKIPELENVDYESLEDMNKYFQLFCQETNIIGVDGEAIEIISGDARELFFEFNNPDFLSDINFDQ